MARMIGDIGFEEDIRSLFRNKDRECMVGRGLDLHDWLQVRTKADEIANQTEAGTMPMDSPWPQERVELFKKWVAEGSPKRRGDSYAAYFDGIDKETEYEDPPGSGLMDKARVVMPFLAQHWWQYAPIAGTPDGDEELEILKEELDDPRISDAVLVVDEMLVRLARQHFEFDGTLDALALLDAFEQFGRDRYPEDVERAAEYPGHFDPGFHRMDSTSMWFNWAGQLECASILVGEDDGTPVRHAMLSALGVGSQMDFVFRDDAKGAKLGQSNPRARALAGYIRNTATERAIRRRGQRSLRRWDRALGQIHQQVAAYMEV